MKVDIRTMERLLRGKCLPAEYLVRQFDALHERAEAAERERDELRESLAVMDGRLSASRALKQLWKNRAGNAEAEIARRDAAASKPVAWISERNLKILGKAFSVVVKHEPVMVRPVALYTSVPPAVLPPKLSMDIDPELQGEFRVHEAIRRKGFNQALDAALELGAQPQKPVVLPEIIRHELIDVLTWIERLPVPTKSAAAKAIRLRKAINDIDAANVKWEVKK